MCVAVAETREDVEGASEEALAMCLARLHEEGLPVPQPGTPDKG
jgi:predicted RNase H-like HicB family nuclease